MEEGDDPGTGRMIGRRLCMDIAEPMSEVAYSKCVELQVR